jgi:sarcosine oxidase
MTIERFDVVVIGLGSMGSAAIYEIANRGLRVLGLEQFHVNHSYGSSHGITRVIRRAYFEHPSYVPLANRSFEKWHALEQESGCHLLTNCGCMALGAPSSEVVVGVEKAAAEHRIPILRFSTDELRRAYPVFQCPDQFVGILEPGAGFVLVEDSIHALTLLAKSKGAVVHEGERVVDWSFNAGLRVETDRRVYECDSIVITSGPWANRLLRHHGLKLRVMRQVAFWIGTSNDESFRRDRFPVYLADTPRGFFYGFPVISPLGHKVARHYGEDELDDIDEVDRNVLPRDEHEVREFLGRFLPSVNGPVGQANTCIYTLSPDRHFIIDKLPDCDRVIVATGFSGHGFKFAPVVGEIVADLATIGTTTLPIEMFRLSRFDRSATNSLRDV